MGNGSQARTRDEDRPPRPGGAEDEQRFPPPGGMAGQGDAPGDAPNGQRSVGDPDTGGQGADGPANGGVGVDGPDTGGQVADGDGRPVPEPDGDRTDDPGGDELIRSVEAERDEYLDALRRLQADFENYRKRVAKQQLEEADRAARSLVDKLLPVLDVLDLAAAHLGDPTSDDGRALVQATALLNDVLTKEGLERIDPIGEPFDPSLHEAVGQLPAETGEPVGSPAETPEPPGPATAGSGPATAGPGPDGPTGNVSDDTRAVDDTADAAGNRDGGTDDGGGQGGGQGGAGATRGDGGPGETGAAHGTSGDDNGGGSGHEVVVAQVMRAGYRWKGSVVRPAMVMVRG